MSRSRPRLRPHYDEELQEALDLSHALFVSANNPDSKPNETKPTAAQPAPAATMAHLPQTNSSNANSQTMTDLIEAQRLTESARNQGLQSLTSITAIGTVSYLLEKGGAISASKMANGVITLRNNYSVEHSFTDENEAKTVLKRIQKEVKSDVNGALTRVGDAKVSPLNDGSYGFTLLQDQFHIFINLEEKKTKKEKFIWNISPEIRERFLDSPITRAAGDAKRETNREGADTKSVPISATTISSNGNREYFKGQFFTLGDRLVSGTSVRTTPDVNIINDSIQRTSGH